MDNLLQIGISKQTIDKMIEKNDRPTIENLDYNFDNVSDVITLLKRYNITSISDMLINYPMIFNEDVNRIKKAIDKNDPSKIVNLLNTNPNLIMELVYDN